MQTNDMCFQRAFERLRQEFIYKGKLVHTERWQGADISNKPEMRTEELHNARIDVPMKGIESLDYWRSDISPNLPWADDHFAERVCGEPLNPGVQWANWPYGKSAAGFRNEHGQFNHSYMERMWPKFAGMTDKGELGGTLCDSSYVVECNRTQEPPGTADQWPSHKGIRWIYGDLGDVVNLLANEPLTRQAWLPLFFPEDTGVGDGGRKPCTLGYQFLMRNNELHIYYPLRSCDYIRHMRDDCYLAVRLLIWVLEQCRKINDRWNDVRPGNYLMHMTSLHIFENDRALIRRAASQTAE